MRLVFAYPCLASTRVAAAMIVATETSDFLYRIGPPRMREAAALRNASSDSDDRWYDPHPWGACVFDRFSSSFSQC
jgi:hypothetical protein